MDDTAVVHSLPVTIVVTFTNYAKNVCIPYLHMQVQNNTKIDTVYMGHILT